MVAEATREKSIYADMFAALREGPGAREASWTKRLREDAMERFERLGFPTTFDEEWKYTNLSALAKRHFEPGFESKSVELESGALEAVAYPEAKGSRLVFVNG